MLRKVLVATFALGILAGACGGEQEPLDPQPLGGPHGEHPFDSRFVTAATALQEIRGHLVAALGLYVDEEVERALQHAKHAVEELETTVDPAVIPDEVDVAAVASELSDVISLVESNAPVGEVVHAIDQVHETVQSVVEDAVEDPTAEEELRASLIIGLLETAARQYGHAVVDSGEEVILPTLYEDAFGFHEVGRGLYSRIESEVIAASPEKAAAIEAAFDTIDHAMPSIHPPSDPVDVAKVESAAESIATLLQETIGALPPKERDPTEIIVEVVGLLDHTLTLVEEGKADAALEVVEEAYLDEYVAVEPEIVDATSGLNEKLEPLLVAQIPKAILDDAPTTELRKLIEEAKRLLGEARDQIQG